MSDDEMLPERSLIAAILSQAAVEAKGYHQCQRRQALRFVNKRGVFDAYCGFLGIDADAVADRINRDNRIAEETYSNGKLQKQATTRPCAPVAVSALRQRGVV